MPPGGRVGEEALAEQAVERRALALAGALLVELLLFGQNHSISDRGQKVVLEIRRLASTSDQASQSVRRSPDAQCSDLVGKFGLIKPSSANRRLTIETS